MLLQSSKKEQKLEKTFFRKTEINRVMALTKQDGSYTKGEDEEERIQLLLKNPERTCDKNKIFLTFGRNENRNC